MNFTWPIIPPPFSSRGQLFTAKLPSGRPHQALDMGTGGNAVLAPASGTVTVNAITKDSRGRVLYIDHGEGYVTQYYHLDSSLVKRHQPVSQGQQIAVVGRSGLPKNNPHLHFMVIYNGSPIDPQTVLPPRESVSGFGSDILYAIERPWGAPSMYNDLFAPPISGQISVGDGSYRSRRRARKDVILGLGAETLLYENEGMGPTIPVSEALTLYPGTRARATFQTFGQDEEDEPGFWDTVLFSEDTDDIFNEDGLYDEDTGEDVGGGGGSGLLIGLGLVVIGLFVFFRRG